MYALAFIITLLILLGIVYIPLLLMALLDYYLQEEKFKISYSVTDWFAGIILLIFVGIIVTTILAISIGIFSNILHFLNQIL